MVVAKPLILCFFNVLLWKHIVLLSLCLLAETMDRLLAGFVLNQSVTGPLPYFTVAIRCNSFYAPIVTKPPDDEHEQKV